MIRFDGSGARAEARDYICPPKCSGTHVVAGFSPRSPAPVPVKAPRSRAESHPSAVHDSQRDKQRCIANDPDEKTWNDCGDEDSAGSAKKSAQTADLTDRFPWKDIAPTDQPRRISRVDQYFVLSLFFAA